MKKYEKIPQFRNVVKEVTEYCNFNELPLPELVFTGKVKLHGTNAGIGYSEEQGLWTQKRSGICTIQDDNYGFAAYVGRNKDFYSVLLRELYDLLNLKDSEQLIIYGEWAGPGIQSGVAISEISQKSFFAFETCYSHGDEWFRHSRMLKDNPEHCFYYIPVWGHIKIDFAKPTLSTNKLVEITELIEKECNYTKNIFGISGIGEGMVWSCVWKDKILRFKVKGEKHSVSKVKKLATINPELVKSIEEFVDYVVTDNRVDQAIREIGAESKADTGKFLKWIHEDILAEETDTLVSSGLEWKDVSKKVSFIARNKFFARI